MERLMPRTRCLIVGARGFIGSNLRCALEQDDRLEINALDRQAMDVRRRSQAKDVVAMLEPDVIINLAGISSPASDDVSNLYQVNAFGHLHLLEAAAALKRRPRVILASSAQLYGPGVVGKAVEMTPLNPVSHYGLSKLLAEKYCGLFAEGVPTVIARIYNAIGQGQSREFLIPKIVAAFRERKRRLEIGSLDVERDFIDARDLSEMWRLVILSDHPPKVVNFSNGETAKVRDIIARLDTITGHRPEVVSNSLMFRKNDIPYQCGDNAIIRGFGYVRRYSLEETLAWMLTDGSELPKD
jgi:GDP-6-deoxy-D-talose 4-dehydrogenase